MSKTKFIDNTKEKPKETTFIRVFNKVGDRWMSTDTLPRDWDDVVLLVRNWSSYNLDLFLAYDNNNRRNSCLYLGIAGDEF